MQAFSFSAQFARESATLKLPEERRRWRESKAAGRGRGERRESAVFFFSPPPPPFPFFALAPTVRVTIFLLSPIFHCHKIKDGSYNSITNTNKVSPTQNTPPLQVKLCYKFIAFIIFKIHCIYFICYKFLTLAVLS